MVILMKFSTGEDWNAYMFELANTEGWNGEACLVSSSLSNYFRKSKRTK